MEDDDPTIELQYLIATAIVVTSLVYGIFRAMIGLTSYLAAGTASSGS